MSFDSYLNHLNFLQQHKNKQLLQELLIRKLITYSQLTFSASKANNLDKTFVYLTGRRRRKPSAL